MQKKNTVLVVDNEWGTRESLRWILKPDYNVRLAGDPAEALRTIHEEKIDVVFSDILMEPYDGITLLRRIKSSHSDIEVIMITAFARQESLLGALRSGACDYLTKPFDSEQIKEALHKALAKRMQAEVERRVIKNLKKNVEKSFQGNVASLMQALSSKDICTYSHSKRVGELFEKFASRYHFTPKELEMYKTMANLHDIGKIGVRDAVLKKKGRLTAEEYEEIKLHPQMGYHIVKYLGLQEESMDLVLYHQERYDGKGYPHGLSGQNIPLTTRLFSIVDAYDSIRRNRPYRKGAPQQETLDEIKRHAGTQFDPELVYDFQSFVEANAARL